MKRIMILGLCLVIIGIGSSGCGKSSDKKEKATKTPVEKAVAKPTAKPTEKPTAKPTEKPTAKPTEKPAEKPIEKVDATVVSIIDGDTITVKIGEKVEPIRFIGVLAPKEGECFAKEAMEHAKKFLTGKSVKLGKDENLQDRDEHGNLLRYVWFADGKTLFNEVVIEFGYAVEYTDKTSYTNQAEFQQAQKRAQEQQEGLWHPDTCGGKLQPADAQGRALKPPSTPVPAEAKFSCEAKKTCTKMASCEEAYFHLSACKNATLDQDKNGVPCESLCKEDTKTFSCETKKTCTKMASCVEAYYHLLVCKNTNLDQNKDGVPCEAICQGVKQP